MQPPSRYPFLALPRHHPAARRGNSTWRGLASLVGRKHQVTVSYTTADGTAEEPVDYTDTSGSLTFAAGDQTKVVTVATSTDSLNEANETFEFTLSNPGNARLDANDYEAEGTIEDDDELTAAVESDAVNVDEGKSATFTVTLTDGTSTEEVVVLYSEVGSATAGDDYAAPSGALTIAAEGDRGQITIETREDTVLDRNETLVVRLDSATSAGAVEVSATTAETQIIDSGDVKITVQAAVLVADDPDTEDTDESQDSSVVDEGETASFTVTLSGAVGVDVLVPYQTVDGTALAGADKDYTANRGTLTFASSSSDTSKTIEIVTSDDDQIEATETFQVELTPTSGDLPERVTVTTASATGTITDTDALTAEVIADDPFVTESQSATFTVTLTEGKSTAQVVVDYSLVGDPPTAGTDYTAPSGKLTIGASVASGTITVATLQDDVLDRGETLVVRLDKARTDGVVNVSTDTAKTTIRDPGEVKVSVAGLTVEEEQGDPPETVEVDKSSVEEGEQARFVMALSGPVEKTVEVSYATADGTGDDAATAGTDYTAATTIKLTFAPKETSKTVSVATTADTDNEADETFTVTLTGVTLPDGVSLDADATTATGTIENDDGLTATVTANADNVPEGQNAEFTVELTDGTSTAPVEVTYTVGGTATSGDDYTAPTDLTFTIGTGVASGTIAIATLTDSVLDPGETLSITLRSATTAIGTVKIGAPGIEEPLVDPATATTTIAEKGTVTVSVKAEEVEDDDSTPEDEYEDKSEVEEGGSASFIVELSGAVASTVQVAYATSSDTGAGHATAGDDYTATSGALTLTFTPGESRSQTIAVATTNDNLNEPTEQFTVTLTKPDPPGFPDLVSIGTSSVQGTITDDDGLTAAVTAVADSVDEGEIAEFEVALTPATITSTAPVEVTFTVGGTATAGDDYTAPTDLTLTIATGATSGTISIEVLTDREVENNAETLAVTLTEAFTATGTATVDADNVTASMAINNTTRATITPQPPPGSSRTAVASRSAYAPPAEWAANRSGRLYSAGHCYTCGHEGEPITIYLALTDPDDTTQLVDLQEGETVLVPYGTRDLDMSDPAAATAGSDYTTKNGTLTFTRGDKGKARAEVPLQIAQDARNERDEEFEIVFSQTMLPDGTNTTPGPVLVTIDDDDPITATMAPRQDVSVVEGSREPVTFTVRLSGGTSTEPVVNTKPVLVRYRTANGSATAPGDYTALSGTLTFASMSETKTFTLNTRDDDELETAETLTVRLAGGESAGEVKATASTEVTITDDDTLSVDLAAPPAAVVEGKTASLEVTLSAATSQDVVVSYATSSGAGDAGAVAGDDFTAVDGTLTFGANLALTTQTITVATIDDDLNEATETFTVTLGQVTMPDGVELGDTDATVEILDNDDLTVMVTADADIVAEGDPATFTVALAGGTSTGDVVVVYTVDDTADDAATANVDYTAPDGTLTIGMGEASGSITIATHTDEEVEQDETLLVTLQRASTVGEVKVDPTSAMTTVIDPPAVTIGDANAAENAGSIVFEVSLSAPSPRQVTVSYDTEDGTAKAGEDYTEAKGTLTLAEMVIVATISIAVRDDTLDEEDETFTVRLSDPVYGRFGDTGITATGTIIDDDDPPAVSIHDASAKERAGEIAFRVSLDAPSGRRVAVGYRTEDGTAKAGSDYGETDGSVTLEAGQTATTIPVTLKNDTLEEPDETFTVRLMERENEPTHAALPADPTATGTIIDDDVSVAQVWLARFGRTVATHVVDAVSERLSEAGAPSAVAIAGHPVQPAPVPADPQDVTPIPFRALAGSELIAGSSFRLASHAGEEEIAGDGLTKWTGWGRGAVTRLAGKEPKADLSLRGTIATGTAGVDYDWGGVLTGLAMAYTGGGGNFQTDDPHLEPRSGTAEIWMLSAHPYARVNVVDGLEVWGLLGYGLGMMSLTEDRTVDTNIRLMMGAAGVRGILLAPVANGGFGVAVSSDGFAMRANADAAGRQPAVEADAVRGRLLVEGSYDAQLGDGSVLTPMVEAGMRYDAGHAEEGFGAELGGGFRYVKPEWGLTATANGRFVLAHQDRDFQEWGLRGSLQLSPGAGGLGPSLGIDTAVGTSVSGVQRLWAQGATPLPAAPQSDVPAGRLDARLGYGMSVDILGTNALVTPYAGLTLADGGAQAYRVGGRANLGQSFSLSLEGERRESSGAAPAHGITLSGSLSW